MLKHDPSCLQKLRNHKTNNVLGSARIGLFPKQLGGGTARRAKLNQPGGALDCHALCASGELAGRRVRMVSGCVKRDLLDILFH